MAFRLPLYIFRRSPAGGAVLSARAWLAAAGVFVACLFVYNLNGVPLSSSDNKASLLLPHALLTRGSIDLAPYFPSVGEAEPVPYFFRGHGALLSSDKLVFYAVVATPFYAIGWGAVRLATGPLPELRFADYRADPPLAWFAVEKLTASLMAATTSALMWLALWVYWRRWRVAWLGTAAFAFLSSHWATSSQGMWNHGGLALLVAIVVLAWARLERAAADALSPRAIGATLLAGSLAAAWLTPVRPTGVGYALAWLGYLGWRWRGWFWRAAVPVAAMGAALFAFNLAMAGSLAGYYGMGQAPFWHYGWWENFKAWAGLLVSPGNGLFFFTPLAALAVIGGVVAWRRRGADDCALRGWVAPVFVCWAAAATNTDSIPQLRWHAAASFGPRYFVDALPALLLLGVHGAAALDAAAGGWSRTAKLALAATIGGAAACSAGAQVVGVFFFKFHHALQPQPIHLTPERMWDWRDNPLAREVRTGLNPDTGLVWATLLRLVDRPHLLRTDHPVAAVGVTADTTGWVAGERRLVEFGVRNIDPAAWPSGLAFGFDLPLVGGRWRRADGAIFPALPERSLLPLAAALGPGATRRWPVTVAAPATPGTYALELELTQRGRSLGPGAVVRVTVSAPADRR